MFSIFFCPMVVWICLAVRPGYNAIIGTGIVVEKIVDSKVISFIAVEIAFQCHG